LRGLGQLVPSRRRAAGPPAGVDHRDGISDEAAIPIEGLAVTCVDVLLQQRGAWAAVHARVMMASLVDLVSSACVTGVSTLLGNIVASSGEPASSRILACGQPAI
jgi:hypothetical protein